MKEPRLHPLYIVREKYDSSNFLDKDKKWEESYFKYKNNMNRFVSFCSDTVDVLKSSSWKEKIDSKEASISYNWYPTTYNLCSPVSFHHT